MSGGSGIQTDLKAFQGFNVHGVPVIICVTAQNSLGVTHVEHLSCDSVGQQAVAVLSDPVIPALETRML
ncbi:bifunctional hydroxymethylpyrimidine kinase/phosphomethylpyrimidine kinase [Synechococcus sp. A15-127]|uniref:bifunctional hydroxymethylpyrimidine kinase/phosphomethylpyrimidine kinase n=1 Tax=Synechococcus sp. A15-127 TaxID=1050624 RepID=UPI0016460C8A